MVSTDDSDNTRTNANSNKDNITIKKSTFTKIIVGGVAALMVASFFVGYNLGGGGKTLPVILGGGGAQSSLPSGVQPLQIPSTPSQVTPVKVSSIALDSAPFKGMADAPIIFVEFSDFQCPFCQSFFSQTESQLLKAYVDTGKVKFVYKQFPMQDLHPNAREAALSSECANEQGKFWQYHDALFGNQTTWANQNSTEVSNTFKKYASDLKLDTPSFNSCLDSKKYSSIVDKDSQEASSYGVTGTPTFFIGNDKNGYTQFVGVQPFPVFQQTIDQQLKQ
jgi:protein-disulfide isomerase